MKAIATQNGYVSCNIKMHCPKMYYESMSQKRNEALEEAKKRYVQERGEIPNLTERIGEYLMAAI